MFFLKFKEDSLAVEDAGSGPVYELKPIMYRGFHLQK